MSEIGCCDGCGSTKTIEQIRAESPTALSCCPERKMLTAAQWRERAIALQDALRLAANIRTLQKAYFKSRSREDLVASKQAEAQFDKAVKELGLDG